jgi:hypothetical protein
MQNMINESERDTPADDDHPFEFQTPQAEVEQVLTEFAAFLRMNEKIQDACIHTQIRNALVEHLCVRRGNHMIRCNLFLF